MDLLTYGPGTPRYVALWLLAAPLLVLVGWRAGIRGRAMALLVATTLPTMALHVEALPGTVPFWLRWTGVMASTTAVGLLLWRVLQRPEEAAAPSASRPMVHPTAALLGLVVVVVAARAVVALLDPGISDIPQASEVAARQLLGGANPYVSTNLHTVAGVYQYPAGTLLWHLPFVALLPEGEGLGEAFLAARVAAWTVDALVVLALGLVGVHAWRAGRTGGPAEPTHGAAVHPIALAPAVLYGLHPTVVRETGLTVANDVLMGVGVAATAWLLARRDRPTLTAIAFGLTVAVKPPAVVLLPLVLRLAGWRTVLLAGGLAAGLQLPFLLWPDVGPHGLAALAEPAARAADGYDVLRFSAWWPLYAQAGATGAVVRATGVVATGLAVLVAWWAGRVLVDGEPRVVTAPEPRCAVAIELGRVAAAASLPLLVLFLLAPGWRTNFQDWMLPAAVLSAMWPLLVRHRDAVPAARGAA